MKFRVRYVAGYALRFDGTIVRSVIDADASEFDSQEDAARAITAAKLRLSTVEIEQIGKDATG